MSMGGDVFNTELNAFLAAERKHESGGDYTAYNAAGGASGAYQFIQSTWSAWANRAGYSQYAGGPASSAPPAVQDAVAAAMATSYYQTYGGNWQDVAEAWYYPAWAGNPAYQNDVPYPSAGNTVTIGNYGKMVVDTMNQYLGGTPIPDSTGGAGGGVGGGAGGGAVGSDLVPAGGGGGATGTPPSMSDIPALKQYIEQNFGSDAWLLSIPDVATVLEEAVVQGLDATQIQARIQQTEWWRTTSQAVKNYEEQVAQNPAEFSFTTPGSQASQMLAQIMATAATTGVTLTSQQAQTLATDAMKYAWNSQQMQAAIGAQATVATAQPVDQQLKAMAMQYYMPISPQALQTWVTNIAGGTQTIQQFQAQMAQDAAQKWTGFAPQLQAGSTMQQLTDSLRTEAAKTMEVDPTQIDFMNNPTYSKILDYVPPNSPNGVHRVMTTSEMDQYLKSTPAWGYTQGGRDSAAALEQEITQTFGKMAG